MVDPANVEFLDQYSLDALVAFKIPAEWERVREQEIDDDQVVALFLEPSHGAEDQVRESIAILRVRADEERNSDAGIRNEVVRESRAQSIGGFDGLEEIVDATIVDVPGVDFRFLNIAVEFDGYVYAVLHIAERSQFQRNVDITRFVAESMDIGQVIFRDTELSTYENTLPGLAYDGTNLLVVGCRIFDTPRRTGIIGRFVRPDRSMGSEFVIDSNVTGNADCFFYNPMVSFDGANYLISYSSFDNGIHKLIARRMNPQGEFLEEDSIVVAESADASFNYPVHSYDGNRHFFVWQEASLAGQMDAIKGTFLNVDDTVEASFLIQDSPSRSCSMEFRCEMKLDLGFLDDRFLVVWTTLTNNSYQYELPVGIYANLIGLDGSLLRPSAFELVPNNNDFPRYPSVSSDGERFMLAWVAGGSPDGQELESAVYAQPLASDGNMDQQRVIIDGASTTDSDLPRQIEKNSLSVFQSVDGYQFVWTTDDDVFIATSLSDLSNLSTASSIGGRPRASQALGGVSPGPVNIAEINDKVFATWMNDSHSVIGWFD